ncbi:MAG: hypothetical protein S4CHLAM20_02280 [Chlamydiia bacterium]|nr:hypothetical protein [Chlamydiia bacterium]
MRVLFFLMFFCSVFSQGIEFSISGGMGKRRLKNLQMRYNLLTFIETGTYEGATTGKACRYFEDVFTIELSEELYKKSKERLKKTQITFIHGSSDEELDKLLSHYSPDRTLIFLDAHFSRCDTVKGKNDPPLLDELVTIQKYIKESTVILVDDVRCFKTSFVAPMNEYIAHYPKINDVFNFVKNNYPKGFEFYIIGDQAIIYNTEYYKNKPSNGLKLFTDYYLEEDLDRMIGLAYESVENLTAREKSLICQMALKATQVPKLSFISALITKNLNQVNYKEHMQKARQYKLDEEVLSRLNSL